MSENREEKFPEEDPERAERAERAEPAEPANVGIEIGEGKEKNNDQEKKLKDDKDSFREKLEKKIKDNHQKIQALKSPHAHSGEVTSPDDMYRGFYNLLKTCSAKGLEWKNNNMKRDISIYDDTKDDEVGAVIRKNLESRYSKGFQDHFSDLEGGLASKADFWAEKGNLDGTALGKGKYILGSIGEGLARYVLPVFRPLAAVADSVVRLSPNLHDKINKKLSGGAENNEEQPQQPRPGS